jgi:hypothetical protein
VEKKMVLQEIIADLRKKLPRDEFVGRMRDMKKNRVGKK